MRSATHIAVYAALFLNTVGNYFGDLSENHVGLLNTCVTIPSLGDTIHKTALPVTQISCVPCIDPDIARI
jgi:hypothetical protein